jgi:hypothetical protein
LGSKNGTFLESETPLLHLHNAFFCSQKQLAISQSSFLNQFERIEGLYQLRLNSHRWLLAAQLINGRTSKRLSFPMNSQKWKTETSK